MTKIRGIVVNEICYMMCRVDMKYTLTLTITQVTLTIKKLMTLTTDNQEAINSIWATCDTELVSNVQYSWHESLKKKGTKSYL